MRVGAVPKPCAKPHPSPRQAPGGAAASPPPLQGSAAITKGCG